MRYTGAWLLVNPLTLAPITPEEQAACDAANGSFTQDALKPRLLPRNASAAAAGTCLPPAGQPGWPHQSNHYNVHRHCWQAG